MFCCYKRRKFLQSLTKNLGPCMLRALRDDDVCQQALCAMLEMDVVDSRDLKLQLITTLQSTASGKKHYTLLCEKQMHLKQLVSDPSFLQNTLRGNFLSKIYVIFKILFLWLQRKKDVTFVLFAFYLLKFYSYIKIFFY